IAGVLPLPGLEASFPDHPIPKRHDQTGFLGNRHKTGWGNLAALGMKPTQERLPLNHSAGSKVNLRLEPQRELTLVDGVPEHPFEFDTRPGFLTSFAIEYLDTIRSLLHRALSRRNGSNPLAIWRDWDRDLCRHLPRCRPDDRQVQRH